MIHFIPAWYQKNKWCENEQKWYSARLRTEFDDTVKQIQLFHRHKVFPFQILLLSFAPNFRHFLHRQGVYRVPYWSCFDAMQEVRRKKAMLLSFYNLNWPDEIEFIYTPFVVVALLKGKKFAQIEFGEDGNPIQVDMFENEIIKRRNIYDDRGFVSSTILFEEGKPLYQDYLTVKGMWKLREYSSDGHVEVNPKAPYYLLDHKNKSIKKEFTFLTYNSLAEIIFEVAANYVDLLEKEDLFCMAMDSGHNQLLYDILKDKKPILSFYENRCKIKKEGIVQKLIEGAGCVVADTMDKVVQMETLYNGYQGMVKDISPFDTRLNLGISQQIYGQKIMVPVDGMKEEKLERLVSQLGAYLQKNSRAQIHFLTRLSDYNREMLLLQKTRTYLEKYGLSPEWAAPANRENERENDLEAELIPKRFFVEQCVEDYKVSNCMKEQRILVDLREVSEVYLQVLAISVGIPQLVAKESEFVYPGKNGFILEENENLEQYLDFYLVGLSNWNKAMIYSCEIGRNYSADILVEKWKEVINCVRND